MLKSNKSRLVMALLLCMIAVALVDPRSHTPEAAPEAFTEAQRRAFQVLEGPTTPLPRRLVTSLRSLREAWINTLWLGSAKHVGPQKRGLWVVNGKSVTCIIQAANGAVSCTEPANFLKRGLILGTFAAVRLPTESPHKFFAWGIAPDWMRGVRLRVGHKFQRVAAQRNFYSLSAPSPIFLAARIADPKTRGQIRPKLNRARAAGNGSASRR